MEDYNDINIFQLVFFVSMIPIWNCSLNFLGKISTNFDIAKNANHFLHALLFSVLYRMNNLVEIRYLILLSMSFYTYDLLYIIYSLFINNDKFNKQVPFIIHHIIANYGLYLAYTDYFTSHILYIYYLLELSNYMLYTSYYISKRWLNYKNLQLVSFSFQFVWYSYFRVIRYSLYIYKIWTIFMSTSNYVIIANTILYLMGVLWSFNLFKKVLKQLGVIEVPITKKIE